MTPGFANAAYRTGWTLMTTPSTAAPRLPWDAADPYPFYAWRRRDGEVVWDDTAQAWLVFSYDAAQQVLGGSGWTSDPRANPTARAALDCIGPELANQYMLFTDGDDHRRLRGSVRDVFTPSFINGLAAGVESIAAARDRSSARTARCSTSWPTSPCPCRSPLSADGWAWIRELDAPPWESPAIIRTLSRSPTRAIASGVGRLATLVAQFLPLAAERRSNPSDDLLSYIAADLDLLLDEVVITALIAVAGHETTANLLGAAVFRLLTPCPDGTRIDRRPRPGRSVADHRTAAARRPGAGHGAHRDRDHLVGGVEIGRPTSLVVVAAANRDPSVFDEPDQLRLDRGGPRR